MMRSSAERLAEEGDGEHERDHEIELHNRPGEVRADCAERAIVGIAADDEVAEAGRGEHQQRASGKSKAPGRPTAASAMMNIGTPAGIEIAVAWTAEPLITPRRTDALVIAYVVADSRPNNPPSTPNSPEATRRP